MIRLSQSEIEQYKADPWHWYFSMYLGYATKGSQNASPISFGTAFHEAMEVWYDPEDLPLRYDRALHAIDQHYESTTYSDPVEWAKADDERKLVRQVFKRYIDHYADHDDIGEVEGSEIKLEYQVSDHTVWVGKADLVTNRGSVDHKTGKRIKTGYSSGYAHRHQLRFYNLLLWKTSGVFRGEAMYNVVRAGVPTAKTAKDAVWFYREPIYYSAPELNGFEQSVRMVSIEIENVRNILDDGMDFRDILYPSYDPTSYRNNPFIEHYPMLWERKDDRWKDIFDDQFVSVDPMERYNDDDRDDDIES